MPIGAQSNAEAYRLKTQGTHSHLAAVLLTCCCWGGAPWFVAQRIAQATCKDNHQAGVPSHPDIVNLSRIGTEGEHSGNVRRDAFVSFKPRDGSVQLQYVLTPVLKTKATERLEPAWIWVPMILPNLLFDSLYHTYPKKFRSMLGDGLEKFWSQVAWGNMVQN